MPIVLRFFVGGLFVVLFSVLGETFKPKSFAGIFGAAPSIALAGLILCFTEHGERDTLLMVHSMSFGAISLLLYCVSLEVLLRRTRVTPWLSAALLWIEWLATAWGFYRVVLK
jgi:uncharacterized membrane protein (GlpM family)